MINDKVSNERTGKTSSKPYGNCTGVHYFKGRIKLSNKDRLK